MKKLNLKSILLTAVAVFGLGACAMGQTPDPIIFNATCSTGQTLRYRVTSPNTVTLVSRVAGSGSDLVIPAEVEHDGTTYRVNVIKSGALTDPFLYTVSIPWSIDTIQALAFDCPFHDVHFNARNCHIGQQQSSSNFGWGPMSLFIGDSVVRICDSAFAQITTFFRLEIGQSVAHIGYHAFKNARIDTIVSHAVIAPTLGDTVNVYNPETEEFEDTYLNAFGKDYFSNPYVRIPCGSYGSYSQDHHWTDVFDRIYEEIDYEVTANAANGGKAFVLEMICEDQKAVIKAEPDYGFMFSNWSDGNTDNPRTLYLTQDTVLTAFFTPTAICENGETAVSVYPNPTNGTFTIEAEDITNVEIFDLAGQKVLTDRSGNRTINAGSLPTGVYFLKVETATETKYGKLIKK